MSETYVLTVGLHVLAALVWLGGMLFLALAAPVLRTVEDDGVRARLFGALGRRFRAVGWVCLALLVVTGIEQLRFRGWWGATFWRLSELLGSSQGRELLAKLSLVSCMIGVQAVHDFWLGPRAGAAAAGSPEAHAWRARASWAARLNALLGIALVFAAVRLTR